MIFPGTMFAVICKQERSVCYLLRLSKSQSIIQLGDSTQSKQIRKMYFSASFIKSIIISIYSLTISTISSHSFLFVIIFNHCHKKKKTNSKKNCMVIGSFQKNVLHVWSIAAVPGPKCVSSVFRGQEFIPVLQQQLTSEETPSFLSETICSFQKYPCSQIPPQQDMATCRECWWLWWPRQGGAGISDSVTASGPWQDYGELLRSWKALGVFLALGVLSFAHTITLEVGFQFQFLLF